MADIEQVVLEISERMSNRWHKDKFSSMGGLFELAIREALAHPSIRAHILQSAWRPISEVPVRPFDKDKWYLNALRCLGNVSVNGYVDIISYGYTERGKGRWQDSNGRICIPTHFQPLPLPPTGGDDND